MTVGTSIAQVHREKLKFTPGACLVTGCTVVSALFGPISSWYLVNYQKPGTWDLTDLAKLWGINVVLFAGTVQIERLVYDSFERNLKSVLANGYTMKRFLFHFVTLLLFAECLPMGLTALLAEDAKPRLDLNLAIKFVGHMALADIVWFRNAHQLMHRYIPSLHYLHHCAFVPSFSSNFFFSVGDFMMEFGGPILAAVALYGTNLVGLRDPFAFLVCTTFTQFFYIMDHDRLLQLTHYKHHTLLNCNYYVYKPGLSSRDKLEKLRGFIHREECDKMTS